MWLVGWVERVFYFIYSVRGGEGRGGEGSGWLINWLIDGYSSIIGEARWGELTWGRYGNWCRYRRWGRGGVIISSYRINLPIIMIVRKVKWRKVRGGECKIFFLPNMSKPVNSSIHFVGSALVYSFFFFLISYYLIIIVGSLGLVSTARHYSMLYRCHISIVPVPNFLHPGTVSHRRSNPIKHE